MDNARTHINTPSVMMHESPALNAEYTNQLLYGEAIDVLRNEGDWMHVRAVHNNYEGYIPSASLKTHKNKTHKVSAPLTHIYETADFKSQMRQPLYFLSPVCVRSDTQQNGFVQLQNDGWVFADHLTELNIMHSDFVETALRFKGAPYIWGGRCVNGIDCSGLVQISLMAAGIDCPRDTKDQTQYFNHEIDADNLQRGDLVFFERHVGIMIDDSQLLNATSRHMCTLIENVSALERVYGGINAIRRVSTG